VSAALLALAAAALAPAEPPPAAPAPPVEERGPLESWTCTVGERLDQHVGGMLQMLVDPDGTRRALSFYVSWSEKPGYMALQQMRWVWIPLDATRLWKPDDFTIFIADGEADEDDRAVFTAPERASIWGSPGSRIVSLRPHFQRSKLHVEDGYLVAQLWAGWPWTAELRGREGERLGSQAFLLPGPETAQAMFTRLRAALDLAAADPAARCQANHGPTQRELEESQAHYGTPISRPNLEPSVPVTVLPPKK
jgi:hypothetical protein